MRPVRFPGWPRTLTASPERESDTIERLEHRSTDRRRSVASGSTESRRKVGSKRGSTGALLGGSVLLSALLRRERTMDVQDGVRIRWRQWQCGCSPRRIRSWVIWTRVECAVHRCETRTTSSSLMSTSCTPPVSSRTRNPSGVASAHGRQWDRAVRWRWVTFSATPRGDRFAVRRARSDSLRCTPTAATLSLTLSSSRRTSTAGGATGLLVGDLDTPRIGKRLEDPFAVLVGRLGSQPSASSLQPQSSRP